MDIDIPMRDGWLSKAFISRPSPSTRKEAGPLIVLYHGGGFFTGAPQSVRSTARAFVRLFGAVVVCPSYRLAPEDKFPTGVNDAWDVLRWLAQNAGSLHADPRAGFVIGGNSAGGNFTAVLARRAVEERLDPMLTGQWPAFPVLFNHAGDTVPANYRDVWVSWAQNRDALLVDAGRVGTMFEYYQPDFNSPLYNPLVSSSPFDISAMPKAFIQVAGMDLVRDDGILYAYMLEDQGVEVRLKAYGGFPHVFWAFVPGLKGTITALEDIGMGMGWLLGKEVSREEVRRAMRVG